MNHMRNIKEMLSIPTGSRWMAYHYFSSTGNNFAQGCCQWFSMCHITYDTNFVCASVCWRDFFKHCLFCGPNKLSVCVFFSHQTCGGKTINRNGATTGFSSFTDSQIFFGSQFWPENSQGLSQDMSVSSRTSQQSSQEVRGSNISLSLSISLSQGYGQTPLV